MQNAFCICVSDDPFLWSSVLQPISQTLHSASTSLVSPVVDVYLSSDNPDTLYTLFRRTLTSLIHHCKDVEGFSGITTEPIVAQFCSTVSQTPRDKVGVERVRRMLNLTSVLCGARQGSHLTSTSHRASHTTIYFFNSHATTAGRNTVYTNPWVPSSSLKSVGHSQTGYLYGYQSDSSLTGV